MAIEPDDPLTAALLLADALDRHRISYAIGGALAYGLWGIPRATIDVDINVFSSDDELPTLFDALAELGIEVDRDRAIAQIDQRP